MGGCLSTPHLRDKRLKWDNKYDGDTGSLTALYTTDAVKEINDYLNSAKAYLGTKQDLLNSPSVDPTLRVIRNMTGYPEEPEK